MTTRPFRACAVALLLCILAAPGLSAQEAGAEARSGWELAPYIGGYDDRPEFGPAESSTFVDPEGNLLSGARLGYTFASGLFLEGGAGAVSLLLNSAPGSSANQSRELDLLEYGGVLGYNLRLHRRIELFGSAGLGVSRWSPEDLDAETDLTLSYGAGARYLLSDGFGLRAGVRLFQAPDALADTRSRVGAAPSDGTLWGWASTLGFSFFFGGGEDGEAAMPMQEERPQPPRDRDSDGDGVMDRNDACPDTRAGAEVDARGCALDGDRDGVPDGIDRCPDTPRGARVDDRGCAGDEDRDGVVNGVDRCPGTPRGARVDARGCALDGDGDGVPDGIDECPDTEAGAEVDDAGCALEPEMPSSLESVHFDFNSARLRASAESVLDEVGRVLSENPDVGIRIEGHADSIGVAGYNLSLSERRARAVRRYLVRNFPSITESRLQVRGFGETRPVADNGTEAGRQRNRRVEFVVLNR